MSSGQAMNIIEKLANEVPGIGVAWAGQSYQERLSSGQAPILYAVALIVVFSRQVLTLIDRAREVERASGLGLIPALLILIVVFLFHQQGKRQESKAQGVTMALPSEIDVEAIVGRADQALYRAKEQGRNCVRLSAEVAVA